MMIKASRSLPDRDPDQLPARAVWLERNREVDRLNIVIEELRSSLEKTNQRLNRLLGERKQLAALLDKRDGQLQELNRELGARPPVRSASTFGIDDPARGGSLPVSSAVSLLSRAKAAMLRRPLLPAKSVGLQQEAAVASASVRAPLVAHQKSGAVLPSLAVMLIGLDKEQISHLLPVIERDCSKQKMMPVCITDNDAFEQLRERSMIFEYLPPVDDRHRFDPALQWNLYLQRRLALIRKKWQPARIVAFGNDATGLLNLWHDSPFEDTPLPAVMLRSSTIPS